MRWLVAATAAATVLGCAAQWPLELLGNFRVQYAALALAAALWLAMRRHLRLAIAALACSLVNLAFVAGASSYHRPSPFPPAGSHTVRALLINLRTVNTSYERVRRLIHDADPDVVMALELGHEWFAQLQLERAYPFAEVRILDNNFGIGCFSRFPMTSSRMVYLGPVGVPSVMATIQVSGQPLTLVGTHPWSPVTPQQAAWRDEQLDALGEFLAQQDGPVMVLADLNATPWSPVFRRLLARSGLRDSRIGFGIQPSWPAMFPPMAVPIDHALVSRQVRVLARRMGPFVGSDHLPVILDVAVAPE